MSDQRIKQLEAKEILPHILKNALAKSHKSFWSNVDWLDFIEKGTVIFAKYADA